ncbi:hypothetical protein [Paracidovorax citrulli]
MPRYTLITATDAPVGANPSTADIPPGELGAFQFRGAKVRLHLMGDGKTVVATKKIRTCSLLAMLRTLFGLEGGRRWKLRWSDARDVLSQVRIQRQPQTQPQPQPQPRPAMLEPRPNLDTIPALVFEVIEAWFDAETVQALSETCRAMEQRLKPQREWHALCWRITCIVSPRAWFAMLDLAAGGKQPVNNLKSRARLLELLARQIARLPVVHRQAACNALLPLLNGLKPPSAAAPAITRLALAAFIREFKVDELALCEAGAAALAWSPDDEACHRREALHAASCCRDMSRSYRDHLASLSPPMAQAEAWPPGQRSQALQCYFQLRYGKRRGSDQGGGRWPAALAEALALKDPSLRAQALLLLASVAPSELDDVTQPLIDGLIEVQERGPIKLWMELPKKNKAVYEAILERGAGPGGMSLPMTIAQHAGSQIEQLGWHFVESRDSPLHGWLDQFADRTVPAQVRAHAMVTMADALGSVTHPALGGLWERLLRVDRAGLTAQQCASVLTALASALRQINEPELNLPDSLPVHNRRIHLLLDAAAAVPDGDHLLDLYSGIGKQLPRQPDDAIFIAVGQLSEARQVFFLIGAYARLTLDRRTLLHSATLLGEGKVPVPLREPFLHVIAWGCGFGSMPRTLPAQELQALASALLPVAQGTPGEREQLSLFQFAYKVANGGRSRLLPQARPTDALFGVLKQIMRSTVAAAEQTPRAARRGAVLARLARQLTRLDFGAELVFDAIGRLPLEVRSHVLASLAQWSTPTSPHIWQGDRPGNKVRMRLWSMLHELPDHGGAGTLDRAADWFRDRREPSVLSSRKWLAWTIARSQFREAVAALPEGDRIDKG